MIRRSRQAPAASIRDDIRARFLDVLKRAETREAEATADVRHALARAAARKPKGECGSSSRRKRSAGISLLSARRRLA